MSDNVLNWGNYSAFMEVLGYNNKREQLDIMEFRFKIAILGHFCSYFCVFFSLLIFAVKSGIRCMWSRRWTCRIL